MLCYLCCTGGWVGLFFGIYSANIDQFRKMDVKLKNFNWYFATLIGFDTIPPIVLPCFAICCSAKYAYWIAGLSSLVSFGFAIYMANQIYSVAPNTFAEGKADPSTKLACEFYEAMLWLNLIPSICFLLIYILGLCSR